MGWNRFIQRFPSQTTTYGVVFAFLQGIRNRNKRDVEDLRISSFNLKGQKMMDQDERRNTSNPRGKGNPSDTGHDKAAIKKGKTPEDLEKEEEIRDKYTEEDGEIPSHLKKGGNPNRNQDKPDIDKPAYGGK